MANQGASSQCSWQLGWIVELSASWASGLGEPTELRVQLPASVEVGAGFNTNSCSHPGVDSI